MIKFNKTLLGICDYNFVTVNKLPPRDRSSHYHQFNIKTISIIQVADLVSRTFATFEHIDLVGFSMGGLVCRYYLQRLGGLDRVQRFISISTPHQSTLAAYCSLRPGCVQMRPNNEFMTALDRDVENLKRLNFTSIWTPFDLIILPPSSSQLGIGTEIAVPVLAHAFMVADRRCLEAIATALAQPVKSPI